MRSGIPWTCKHAGPTSRQVSRSLLLLICLVGSFPFWVRYSQLGLAGLFEQPMSLTLGATKWKATVTPSNDSERGRRKQVTWLHLHKFGGTFMTKMAGLQGEAFPPGNINGNWMPDFCSTPRGQRILCGERTSSGNAGISWSAMERELDDGDFCDGALVGTMLREPLSALQSVLSHDRFDRIGILETLRTCHEKAPTKHFSYQPASKNSSGAPACLPSWDTYHHFDNFATRTLAGAYYQAPCTIGRLHLEAAKSQLERMDVLIILEELAKHLPQLQDAFKWNVTLVKSWKKVNRNKEEHVRKSDGAFSLEEMAFLKRVNAIDLELYDFALSLSENMTTRAQANMANRGEDLMPQGSQPQVLTKMEALRQRIDNRLQLRGRPPSRF